MKQYKDLLQKVLDKGIRKENRTGIDTIGIIGAHMQFDMADGFPAVTIKKLYWKKAISEMIGFLRGYDNAAQFREIGCDVWDANANKNQHWLNNPERNGEDDLGRIYGVQSRFWRKPSSEYSRLPNIDQLQNVYDDLRQGIDNRREIVTHWNPGEMHLMSLPPCHLMYQFGIQGEYLHLSMYQRSCDLPLGIPFNIAGYSWLLMVMAQITGLKAGTFNHFMHDVHIYENQMSGVMTMLEHEPLPLPQLQINPAIETLDDLETWVTMDDFHLINYENHGSVAMKMAV